MKYEEAMAIVSESVAVCPMALANMYGSSCKFYYKKNNNVLNIFFNDGTHYSDVKIYSTEKYAEWHIYKPATTACLNCFGKGIVSRRLPYGDGKFYLPLICCKCDSFDENINKKYENGYMVPDGVISIFEDGLKEIENKIEGMKMAEEYNLTWEQAKLAMDGGAVCTNNIPAGEHLLFIRENSQTKSSFDNGPYVNCSDFTDSERKVWRIVSLTACDVERQYRWCDGTIIHSLFCLTHEIELTPICVQVMFGELTHKKCIEKFTEQLKQDIEKGKNEMPNPMEKIDAIEQSKQFSFDEAYAEMKNGKFYRAITGHYGDITYRIHNNKLQFFCISENKFTDSEAIYNDLKECIFIEVEYPEKEEIKYSEMGFQINKLDTPISNKEPTISIESRHFDTTIYFIMKNRETEREWAIALNTFMLLKSHPLAVKVILGKKQFFICLHSDGYICIEDHLNYGKLDEISPAFKSNEDAQKAIDDIGKDNIMHMFKTFQGLGYDEQSY